MCMLLLALDHEGTVTFQTQLHGTHKYVVTFLSFSNLLQNVSASPAVGRKIQQTCVSAGVWANQNP